MQQSNNGAPFSEFSFRAVFVVEDAGVVFRRCGKVSQRCSSTSSCRACCLPGLHPSSRLVWCVCWSIHVSTLVASRHRPVVGVFEGGNLKQIRGRSTVSIYRTGKSHHESSMELVPLGLESSIGLSIYRTGMVPYMKGSSFSQMSTHLLFLQPPCYNTAWSTLG